MRNLLLKLSGVAIALTLLIATGCEDDNPIITNPLGPELSFNTGVGLTSMDAELAPGETFAVELQALPGDNPLQSFTFLVDAVEPDAGTITNYYNEVVINGSSVVANNPLALSGDFKDGSTIAIEITPFGQMDGDVSTYSFEVTDEVGETAIVSLDITVIDPATPIDTTMTGVLFNQGGPQGTGGLDLDTGEGTGSTADAAEIQDEGIDLDISEANNWRQQISAANNAEMRAADLDALPENFSFDNVTSKEEIESVFETGDALSGSDADCNCTDSVSGEAVTDPVTVGEIYAVQRGDRYYLIRIDEVNNVTVDNSDNYVVSIKY